ncbi:DUF6468 domain-containing protein [Rhodospirillum sp. A1_3_36]|uniref:DUF6468 domain-containing protein n=1 Tax=Rhodospirillum sp. A1_3_36 TaxID=3391666 RepID=UPI0039A66037
MPWQLILDITVAILLLVFIAYAVALSRQLKELRKSRDQMERVIKTFNEATARAEAGIPRLRKTAEEAGRALDERVAKARTLRDDLAYMVERADGMAARLEGSVRFARGESKPSAKDGRVAEGRNGEGKGSEARGVEPRGVEPRGLEPPQGGEARGGAGAAGVEAWARSAGADQDARLTAARPRPRVRADSGDRAISTAVDGGRGPLGGTRPLGGLGVERPKSATGEAGMDDERSEAERELLRALQSAR